MLEPLQFFHRLLRHHHSPPDVLLQVVLEPLQFFHRLLRHLQLVLDLPARLLDVGSHLLLALQVVCDLSQSSDSYLCAE